MSDDTATIERDLAAVEAALASGTTTDAEPSTRDLQELALALTADAPQPSAALAERLGAEVETGFPRPPRAVRGGALRDLSSAFAPLAGVVATILLVVGLTVVLANGSGDDDGAAGGSGGGGAGTVEAGGGGAGESRAADSSGARDSARAPAPSKLVDPFGQAAPASPGGGFAPNASSRRIERTFSMELSVPVKEMTRVADEVSSVAYRHGGFVLTSSVNSGEDGGDGEFSLRIPTAELRPALRDLGEIAPVRSQSQEGRDVTRRFVTAKDRLQAARAERSSLLRRLAAATTDEEAESLRRRLDLVAGEINGLQAQLRDLRLRTNYAVVNVSLREADKKDSELGSLGDSIDDAGTLLAGFAGVAIRVLALALPLGAIALLAWLIARGMRKRRRESALV